MLGRHILTTDSGASKAKQYVTGMMLSVDCLSLVGK